MYSFPRSVTFAAFTIASAASTAPTKPLVSTIPSASKGISVSSLFLVVKIKVELLFLASTYHRAREESRDARYRTERRNGCRKGVGCRMSGIGCWIIGVGFHSTEDLVEYSARFSPTLDARHPTPFLHPLRRSVR